jgi:hypothetical protein
MTKPVTLLALLALVGCGGNNADVPSALLDAVKHQGTTAGYPAGPYGTRVGDTVQNLCFDGWTQPKSVGFDVDQLKPLCLGDFHDDPDARLLLVESCAVWCVACRFEYGGSEDHQSLTDALDARRAKGFRVLGTIFQGGDSAPATPKDAVTWAKTFGLDFPFAVDDQHQLALFTSPNVAPFNLLVDTRTMKIVLTLDGDEPAVLYGKVDAFLEKPPE